MGAAAALISASILVSRLLGLGREALLATLIGVNTNGDLYRQAFLIPDFLNYLLWNRTTLTEQAGPSPPCSVSWDGRSSVSRSQCGWPQSQSSLSSSPGFQNLSDWFL
jgi:hypothetical protein